MAQALASRTLVDGDDAGVPPPLSPEEIAEKFPQFEITECLGRGGMGSVYKARQKSLNRWVAIKILAPEREGRERFAERFAREAQTLARLSHPHIVTIHDFGQTDGLFYLVMEYVDGVNLRDLLREGKIEPTQALAIVPPICDALQYAHDKGIVHRDIKPENLLLDRDGRVKIADFGIASLIGAENESAGTPAYMAPEQADAKRDVDHRADIYALGVVLYEMLTGERPGKEVIAPSRKVQIDVRLDEIVLRALEEEPERRYQTVHEFRTGVDTVASDEGAGTLSARPTPWISQIELDALSDDPANWRFAFFYFCRQDPRIVVPKRSHGFGWTINLANPWAVPFMVAAGLGIAAVLKVMRAADLWTRPYQIAAFVAILTVIVWICHRLSRGPIPRKGSPSPLVRTLITATLAFSLAIVLWNMPDHRTSKDMRGGSDPDATAASINLVPFYNTKFDVLERFPGLSTHIDGLPFVESGSIQLYGTQNALRGNELPRSITNIPIGKNFDELHLLHSAAWEEVQDRAVAMIRLHYGDGGHHDFEIQYGVHLMDWNRLPSEEKETLTDEGSKLIWRGAGAFGGTGRLFKTMLRNPSPDRLVESMDVISTGTRVSYQLFAATTANHAPKRVITPGLPLNKPAFAFEGALKVRVVDAATGKPIAGADIAPWGMIAKENIVVPPQLTTITGETIVKYPMNRTEDLNMDVTMPGYHPARGSWREGSIPREQTFRLNRVEAAPKKPIVLPGVPEVASNLPEVIVDVSKDRRFRVDGQDLPSEELLAKLKAISAISPDRPLRIRAENEGKYEDVIKVLDFCSEAGLSNITFEAEPAARQTEPSGDGKPAN